LDFSAGAVNSLELVRRSVQPDGASGTAPQVGVPLIRKQGLCTGITISYSHSSKYFLPKGLHISEILSER